MLNKSQTATDVLKSQTNTEESTQQISSELQTNEPFGDAGIYIRGNEDQGYFATLGSYIIVEKLPTAENVKNVLEKPDANLVAIIAAVAVESTITMEKVGLTIEQYLNGQIPTTNSKGKEQADEFLAQVHNGLNQ